MSALSGCCGGFGLVLQFMISIFLSAVDMLERLGAFATSESFDGK